MPPPSTSRIVGKTPNVFPSKINAAISATTNRSKNVDNDRMREAKFWKRV
jgi:hypothetical protein